MKARLRTIAVAVGACALVTIGWVRYHTEANAFVRADPDEAAKNPAWVQFAVPIAKSAYDKHCAICHGPDLRGDPIKGVPNLADNDWLYGEGRASQIEKTIYYGIRSHNPKGWDLADMPSFGRPAGADPRYKELMPLAPGEISDVVQYLLAKNQRPADAQAAARGRAVFANRGVCFDCHGSDARGDPDIGAPNLSDSIWLYGDGSVSAITESIEYGRRGSCPAWVGRIDPVTVRALAIYIYTASHRQRTSS